MNNNRLLFVSCFFVIMIFLIIHQAGVQHRLDKQKSIPLKIKNGEIYIGDFKRHQDETHLFEVYICQINGIDTLYYYKGSDPRDDGFYSSENLIRKYPK